MSESVLISGKKSLMAKALSPLLFGLGVALLLLNIYGRIVPLRNPAIYTDSNNAFKNDITLTEAQFYSKIEKIPGESREAYVKRATKAVNEGIAHNWHYLNNRYGIRVFPRENYLLYLASFLKPRDLPKVRIHELEKGAPTRNWNVL